MPSSEPSRTLRDYVRILFRRKWHFVMPFVVALFVAGYFFYDTPKEYASRAVMQRVVPQEATLSAKLAEPGQARARIILRRELIRILCAEAYRIRLDTDIKIEEVPAALQPKLAVGAWDEIDADDKLRQDWSRVYKDPRWNRVIAAMMRNIDVRVVGGSPRSPHQIIYITYTHSGGWGPRGREPELAEKVCRGLVDSYIQTSRSGVKKQLEETKKTLQRQLDDLQKKVETKKKAKDDFEKEYLGKMPKDAAGIDEELKSRRAEVIALDEQAKLAKGEITRLAEELAKTPTTIVTERAHGRNPRVEQIEKEIRDYRAELRRLRLRFTEEHPRIKELNDLIEAATQEKASLPADVVEGRREGPNPEWQRLDQQLNERRREVAKLEDRLDDSGRALDSLESEKTDILKRHRAFIALQEEYNRLNEEAVNLSRRIERHVQEILTHDRQEGIRFEVQEYPLTPLDPTKPDPLVFLLFGLLGGAAAGTGLVVLAEHTDHSLRSVSEARRFLKVPVVGTIGVIRTRRSRRVRLLLRIARWALVVVVLGGGVVAGRWVWQKDWHRKQIQLFFDDWRAAIHRWTGGQRPLRPTIQSLVVDVDAEERTVTLTAQNVTDPDGVVQRVEFYRDAKAKYEKDGKGQLEVDKDKELGTDSSSEGGWTWHGKVADWPPGTFFARAQDNAGLWSDEVTVTSTLP